MSCLDILPLHKDMAENLNSVAASHPPAYRGEVTRLHGSRTSDFPDRLRKLRIKRGLSQAALGKLAGLGRQAIGSMERRSTTERRNRGASTAEVEDLARALGVQPCYLAFGSAALGGSSAGFGARLNEARLACGFGVREASHRVDYAEDSTQWAHLEAERYAFDLALVEKVVALVRNCLHGSDSPLRDITAEWLAFGVTKLDG